MILFETERLLVRHFTPADLASVYALSSDPLVMQYIRAPLSIEACQAIIDEQTAGYKKDPHAGRFATLEKNSGSYMGNFLLRPSSFRGGTEVGFASLPYAWGKGYATEITKTALLFAFEELQKQMVFGLTDARHTTAQKVLLSCGFVQRPNYVDNGREMCLFEIMNPSL